MPAELDAIFQKMVAKRPEDRYQSMTEVVSALEGFLFWAREELAAAEELSPAASPSWLPQGGPAAVAARSKARAKQQDTLNSQVDLDTSTSIRRQLLQPAGSRHKPPRLPRVGIALAGLAGMILLGIVITIRSRDGEKTTIEVPDGSQVNVDQKGNVDVTLPAPPNPAGSGEKAGKADAVGEAVSSRPTSASNEITSRNTNRHDSLLVGFNLSGTAVGCVSEVSTFTNLVLIEDWKSETGKRACEAARDRGVKVVLRVFESHRDGREADLQLFLTQNPEIVHAVLWRSWDQSVERIVEFGKRLKSWHPTIAYWVAGGGKNNTALPTTRPRMASMR